MSDERDRGSVWRHITNTPASAGSPIDWRDQSPQRDQDAQRGGSPRGGVDWRDVPGPAGGTTAPSTTVPEATPWYRRHWVLAGLAVVVVLAIGGSFAWKLRQDHVQQAALQRQHEAKLAWARGNAAMEKRDAQAAVAEYTRAIELWPQYAAAYASRGNAQFAQVAHDKALADYDAAIRIDPSYPDAYLARGTLRWAIVQLTAAEADFRKLVELRPDEPFYTGRLARVLDEQKRSGEVENLYRRAYEQDRAREWALAGWLDTVKDNKDNQQMLAEIDRLEAQGVRNHATAYRKGKALLELNRAGDAIPYLKQVALEGDVTTMPTDVALLLAAAYKRSGDGQGCRDLLHNYAQRMGRPELDKPEDCN